MGPFVSKPDTGQVPSCILATSGVRRLPLYFMLDFSCSAGRGFAESAAGQVRNILDTLRTRAQENGKAYKEAPVFYTVIAFRSTSLQLQPLAALWDYPFESLQLEKITPQGTCALGEALAALGRSIEYELKSPGADNGDGAPLVFLFIDATPSDDWIHQWESVAALRVKVFVCANRLAAPGSQMIRENARGIIPDFLPWGDQNQILEKIEEGRKNLKKWQQTIDYPTSY